MCIYRWNLTLGVTVLERVKGTGTLLYSILYMEYSKELTDGYITVARFLQLDSYKIEEKTTETWV